MVVTRPIAIAAKRGIMVLALSYRAMTNGQRFARITVYQTRTYAREEGASSPRTHDPEDSEALIPSQIRAMENALPYECEIAVLSDRLLIPYLSRERRRREKERERRQIERKTGASFEASEGHECVSLRSRELLFFIWLPPSPRATALFISPLLARGEGGGGGRMGRERVARGSRHEKSQREGDGELAPCLGVRVASRRW